jgi:hypothetical protein
MHSLDEYRPTRPDAEGMRHAAAAPRQHPCSKGATMACIDGFVPSGGLVPVMEPG